MCCRLPAKVVLAGLAVANLLPAGRAFAGDAATSPAPNAAGTKVLVLPYQAIYRSVPQAKLNSATELLYKELEQKEGIAIVRGAVSTTEAGKGPSVDAAHAAVEAAVKAEGERRIKDAVAAWKKAIAEYEANAAAIAEAEEYVLVHHRLAQALMKSGQDQEARAAIDVVARMAPGFDLAPLEFSRVYRRWFNEAAAAAVKDRAGQVMVQSALPGAKISLDGRPMEVAPVMLERVVPGKHLVRAEIPEVPAFATIIHVTPGQKLEVRASYAGTLGGSAVGRVTDAIAENGIPRPAVESAAAAGRDVGAKFVVVGAMAKDEDRFQVHTFVVQVESTKIQPLEAASFDLEMLTAESDVLRITNAAFDSFASFPGSAQPSIAQVDKRIRGGQSTITKVDAAPELADASRRSNAKKPAKGPRAVFKPLKGGTVTIKDEEED